MHTYRSVNQLVHPMLLCLMQSMEPLGVLGTSTIVPGTVKGREVALVRYVVGPPSHHGEAAAAALD